MCKILKHDFFEDELVDKKPESLQLFNVLATRPNMIVIDKEVDDIEWQEGWNLDEVNPKKIVMGFSNIKVQSDYKLIGYRCISGGNGNGVVWAIPKGVRSPIVEECEILKEYFLCPPRPRESVKDYMSVIEGDKSPLSYLQAAVLQHELGEYGAAWHGVNWGQDIILPWSRQEIINFGENTYEWDMDEEEPEIIDPHFYFNGEGEPVVVLYTINDIATVTLNEYKHIFNKQNYTMNVERKILGTAGGGIIF